MSRVSFIELASSGPERKTLDIALSPGCTRRLEFRDGHVYLDGVQLYVDANTYQRMSNAVDDYLMHMREEVGCTCPTNTKAAQEILLRAVRRYSRSLS